MKEIPSEKTRAESTSGDTPGASGASSARCTCERCGLYRWYPPMMLVSTVLTAAFCWMYITKPVFLSTPAGREIETRSTIQERRPADTGTPAAHTASKGKLDPALDRLPGDPGSGEENSPVEELLQENLKPLVVEREGPVRFKPVPAGGGAGPPRFRPPAAGRGAGPVVVRRDFPPEPLVIIREQPELTSEGQQPAEDHVVPVGSGVDSDSEEFQVRASLLAEFLPPGQNENVSANPKP